MLHVVVEEGLTDEAYLADHGTGWEEVKANVAQYPPSRAAEICGIPAEQVVQVARAFARAPKAMAFHARGIEHHTQGVENCLSVINLCAATGHIGKPGAGYGTLTGQGNGQGGREHGQKADLLPGGRSILNEEHRRQICEIWGIEESELPAAGTSMMEMVWQMQRREIRGLIGICNNPFVSLPNYAVVKEGYDTTEFHAQFDFFLSETAANAHVVFPVTIWAEDEGVMANAEARVVKHNKAQEPPAGVRTDTWVMCELARRLGAGEKFAFDGSREVFDELRRASAGTIIDYSGITYERLEETGGIAWPCPSTDHPGTPGCSRTAGPTTPTARSTCRSSSGIPGGPVRRRAPHDADHRTHRRPLPLGQPDPPAGGPRRADPAALGGGPPLPRLPQRRTRARRHPARQRGLPRPGHRGDPARHGVHPLPLARPDSGQRTHHRRPRSPLQDPRVQGLRLPHRARRRDRRGPAPPSPPATSPIPRLRSPVPTRCRPRPRRAAAPRKGADAPMMGRTMFIDPGRCIGCQACVSACRECDSHRGKSMIHLDYTDEGSSVASLPTVCMHCEDPVAPCAEVCPADAILVTADGVVQQADTTRCIGCANCVNACPFGVPKIDLQAKLQMKCNLCYDRTAYGLAPMCATVCPTGALFYGTVEELQAERPGVQVADTFVFGESEVRTGVAMVVPAERVQWPVPGGLPVVEINGKDVRR